MARSWGDWPRLAALAALLAAGVVTAAPATDGAAGRQAAASPVASGSSERERSPDLGLGADEPAAVSISVPAHPDHDVLFQLRPIAEGAKVPVASPAAAAPAPPLKAPSAAPSPEIAGRLPVGCERMVGSLARLAKASPVGRCLT